jgi:serine/threonine-protein kinase HipA
MIERLSVLTPQGPSGELSVTPARQYLLRYEIGARPQARVSLTMGGRDAGFATRILRLAAGQRRRAGTRAERLCSNPP